MDFITFCCLKKDFFLNLCVEILGWQNFAFSSLQISLCYLAFSVWLKACLYSYLCDMAYNLCFVFSGYLKIFMLIILSLYLLLLFTFFFLPWVVFYSKHIFMHMGSTTCIQSYITSCWIAWIWELSFISKIIWQRSSGAIAVNGEQNIQTTTPAKWWQEYLGEWRLLGQLCQPMDIGKVCSSTDQWEWHRFRTTTFTWAETSQHVPHWDTGLLLHGGSSFLVLGGGGWDPGTWLLPLSSPSSQTWEEEIESLQAMSTPTFKILYYSHLDQLCKYHLKF